MSTIVMTAIGSCGDVFPTIAIAWRLAEWGHEVRVVVPDEFHPLLATAPFTVVSAASRFSPRTIDANPELMSPHFGGLMMVRRIMRRLIVPDLAGMYGALSDAAKGADVLVTHRVQLAAPMVASELGLPWATVEQFPMLIPSRALTPGLSRVASDPSAVWRATNEVLWRVTQEVMPLVALDADLNAERRRLGFGGVKNVFFSSALSPSLHLVLTSDRYLPRLADWPPQVAVVGFPYWEPPPSPVALEDVSAFIEGGTPPVLVTFGTLNGHKLERTMKNVVDGLADLGLRALLLGAGSCSGRVGEGAAAYPFVPLSIVAPRCAAIIHHGGASTAYIAMRHALPSVVVPHFPDQRLCARQTEALGLGRKLSVHRLTRRNIRRAVARALVQDGRRDAFLSMRNHLAAEDGAARAAEAILSLVPTGRKRDHAVAPYPARVMPVAHGERV